jgi:hypothetical protein
VHCVVAKQVLRYLCGTMDYGLDYLRGDGVRLVGYTGSAVVSWFSQKQKTVTLSSAEAEYMVASQASCEAIWP